MLVTLIVGLIALRARKLKTVIISALVMQVVASIAASIVSRSDVNHLTLLPVMVAADLAVGYLVFLFASRRRLRATTRD